MMRLNIRQLLALPLAFCIAYVIVQPLTLRPISYSWFQAYSDISRIETEIESRRFYRRTYTVDHLSRWLDGKVQPNDPAELHQAVSPGNDPWANAYQVVEIASAKYDHTRFGIYSLGRDGTSSSTGNDLDDINSWADEPLASYQHEANWAQIRERLAATILATPFAYAPLYFLTRTRRKKPTEPE